MHLDVAEISTGQLAACRRTAAIGGTCAIGETEQLAGQTSLTSRKNHLETAALARKWMPKSIENPLREMPRGTKIHPKSTSGPSWGTRGD